MGTPTELASWKAHKAAMGLKQTHCFTCGREFGAVRYECPTCNEPQCSEKCRAKHIKEMDDV